eukprot:scaffold1300_cov317-Prasinococcus_capsulatus_cf.AAC.1
MLLDTFRGLLGGYVYVVWASLPCPPRRVLSTRPARGAQRGDGMGEGSTRRIGPRGSRRWHESEQIHNIRLLYMVKPLS